MAHIDAYDLPDGNFAISHKSSSYKGYSSFPLHNHLSYEIYRLWSDSAVFQVEGRAYDLSSGDIMLFNSHEFHHITFQLDTPYERSVIHLHKEFMHRFTDTDYDLYSGFERRKLGYCNLIKAADAQASGLTALLDELEETAFGDIGAERELLLQCGMLRALIIINRLVTQTEDVSYAATHEQKIMEVIAYINENLAEDLSLDALEKRFFISKYHLAHIFKMATGFPINRYVTNKRIKLADELIAGGMSTLDACVASGFHDYSNFYKSFRKLMGRSPKQSKK